MRLVIFTANRDILEEPWGAILRSSAGVDEILVCVQQPRGGLKATVNRLRKNLRKHGILFIPYRIWATFAERPRQRIAECRFGERSVPNSVLAASSIHQPEVLESVRDWRPDLGISIGAPVLREPLFSIPRYGTVNIHCGEVPDFRGAPPAFWELYAGAERIGATLHRIDRGLDTGDVIERATLPLIPTDTLSSASERAYELGEAVLERGIARLLKNPTAAGSPQDAQGTTNRQPLVATRMALGLRINSARIRRFGLKDIAKSSAALILLAIVRPVRDFVRTVRGRHPLRVFTYHRVTNLCVDGMTISPARFDKQIAYIRKRHRIVSLEEALLQLASGTRIRKPLAVIAFDDAYESVYTHAAPILRARGSTAACFAATGFLGTERRYLHDENCPANGHAAVMTWDELAELSAAGWTIGSHTVNHARLSDCDTSQLESELAQSKNAIEKAFGPSPMTLAYPFGSQTDINQKAISVAKRLGYAACLGDFGGENFAGDDLFTLKRIDIGANHATLMWKLYAHGYDLAGVRRLFAPTQHETEAAKSTADLSPQPPAAG